MPQPSQPEPPTGLSRHDIWLLPLISIATVLVMLIGAEAAARYFWPEQYATACDAPDPVLPHRFRPNCTAVTKLAEGPWVTNSYNACGYRSLAQCGPVPSGTRRIAVIGSSLAEGYMVPYDETIGAQLAVDLTRSCDSPVEVQNLGAHHYTGDYMILRMTEALRLHPDSVVYIMAPADLERDVVAPTSHSEKPGQPTDAFVEGWQKPIFTYIKQSRAVLVAQHFLFRNPSIYLPLYLLYGDRADFLRAPLSPNWMLRINEFDTLIDALSQKAHAAGVRFTVGFVPQEAQVALMAGRPIPPGVDPELLPRTLEAIAARHDVDFVDTSASLRTERAPELLYYQVDGHPSGRAQPIIANYLAAKMIADPHGAFNSCHPVVSGIRASKD